MRAVRLHGVGDLRITDDPMPQEIEGYTRVRIGAVGLCGSDLHWFSEGGIGDVRIEHPSIPGHEQGGVALDGPYAGRVVAIDPALPCRQCARCLEGNTNLCPRIAFSGNAGLDGGLCEVMSWPTHAVVPLPDGMTAEDAAMLEPLGVALHAWDLGHVKLGDRVAVVGAGPIGLFLVQLAARSLTAEVVAVEPLEHRRDAAVRLGADAAFAPGEVAVADFDVVFEACGLPDAVAETAVLARPGGRLVIAGIPEEDEYAFPASAVRRKGLTIAVVRRMKDVYPRAIALVERGQVDVRAVVSHRFDLADSTEAFTFAAGRGGLKVLITSGDAAAHPDPSRGVRVGGDPT